MKRIFLVLLLLSLCLPLLSAPAEEAEEARPVPQVLTQERFQELRERVSSQLSSSDEKKFVRYFGKKTVLKCFAGDADDQVLARHWLKQAAALGEPCAEELLVLADAAVLSPDGPSLPDQLRACADSLGGAAILDKPFWVLSGTPRWAVAEKVQEYLSQIGYTEDEYAADQLWALTPEDALWISPLPDGGAAVVLYGGSEERVTIPAVYEGRPVTQIRSNAFAFHSRLLAVEIPEGVVSIGAHAFANCSDLVSVTLPSSLTDLGPYAFASCEKLEAAAVPGGVAVVPDAVFGGCAGLKRLTLGDGVKTIGDSAFAGCKTLDEIVIPDTVERIGARAFSLSDALTNNGRPVPVTRLTLGSGVVSIGDAAFSGRLITNIRFPDTLTEIGDRAFSACEFQAASEEDTLALPSGLRRLGDYAFCGHRFTSAALPDSLTDVGGNPFLYCSELKEITVSAGHPTLTSIDGVLFGKEDGRLIAYPALHGETYVVPEGTRIIGSGAFYACGRLTGVSLPDTVTTLGSMAFCYCWQLTSLNLPAAVREIADDLYTYFPPELAVTVVPGTVGEQYCADHGLPCQYDE